jgi:hypothetical protein
VLVTDVGEIPAVVQNGKTVLSSRKKVVLCSSCKLIKRKSAAIWRRIYETILNNYSEEEVIKQYLNWVQSMT